MGVRGLSFAVQPYAKFSPLSGRTIVIDGPGLVFSILEGCMLQRPQTDSFICNPSYATVGRLVVGWLDELRKHNVVVRKIYFDGYLPPNKWEIRRQRLQRQSKKMKDLLYAFPHGSSKIQGDSFNSIKVEISLCNGIGNSWYSNRVPKPPFLVPAVLEILRKCKTWGPLVEVVSGEADVFCGDDIKRNGGIVLTGDSDLLIADLGPDGVVSLFSDVATKDPEDEAQGIIAGMHSMDHINSALRLGATGLQRVAYEVQTSLTNFADAVNKVRNMSPQEITNTPGFREFLEEHAKKDYLPSDHPAQGLLSSLDPRISEFIIQTILNPGSTNDPPLEDEIRGPETLAMFLPIMIEKPDRKSVWNMSTPVRQIAYGALQTLTSHPSPIVIEYRALEKGNTKTGLRIDVAEPATTLEQCSLLAATLAYLSQRIRDSANDSDIADGETQWLAFALYQDVMWNQGCKGPPLFAQVLSELDIKATQALEKMQDETETETANSSSNSNMDQPPWEVIDEHSWGIIHLTASVQASLYSLRMTKQILDVVAGLPTVTKTPFPPAMQQLRDCLASLPDISEWPTVETMPRKLAALRKAGVPAAVGKILGFDVDEFLDNMKEKWQNRNSISRMKLKRERDPKRPISVNPFAILSRASVSGEE
ncbi:hypothetical protein F4808DRAFT_436974 [Astrocystis sublimbata]|nr:hypothetical protein F4808DRAFT_436974 [Astrocystis sublimbata]